MDIEFAGQAAEYAVLWRDLDRLGYLLLETRRRDQCDCPGFLRHGLHVHALVEVERPPISLGAALAQEMADQVAAATGVRVEVHHAGQRAFAEPDEDPGVVVTVDGRRVTFTAEEWRAASRAADSQGRRLVVTKDGRRVVMPAVEWAALLRAGVNPYELTADDLAAVRDGGTRTTERIAGFEETMREARLPELWQSGGPVPDCKPAGDHVQSADENVSRRDLEDR